jgi:hypothetical protein
MRFMLGSAVCIYPYSATSKVDIDALPDWRTTGWIQVSSLAVKDTTCRRQAETDLGVDLNHRTENAGGLDELHVR